jgi:hypothetical protein
MITLDRINRIARDVAVANLSSRNVDNVFSEPAADSQGENALRITIVIKPGVAAKLKGDALLDMLVQLQDELQKAGEDRLPIVEYATQEELEDSGDPES